MKWLFVFQLFLGLQKIVARIKRRILGEGALYREQIIRVYFLGGLSAVDFMRNFKVVQIDEDSVSLLTNFRFLNIDDKILDVRGEFFVINENLGFLIFEISGVLNRVRENLFWIERATIGQISHVEPLFLKLQDLFQQLNFDLKNP